MEIRIPSPVSVIRSSESVFKTRISVNPDPNLLQSSRGRRSRTQLLIRDSRFSTRIRAVDEAISTVDPVRAEITWQIIIGALGILKSLFFGPLILLLIRVRILTASVNYWWATYGLQTDG